MYFSRVYLPHTAQVRYLYAAICSVLSMLQVICPVSQDERAKMRGGSRTDLGVQEAQLEVARVAGDVHVTSSTTLAVNLGQLLPSL
jgi:hypothetical protein